MVIFQYTLRCGTHLFLLFVFVVCQRMDLCEELTCFLSDIVGPFPPLFALLSFAESVILYGRPGKIVGSYDVSILFQLFLLGSRYEVSRRIFFLFDGIQHFIWDAAKFETPQMFLKHNISKAWILLSNSAVRNEILWKHPSSC